MPLLLGLKARVSQVLGLKVLATTPGCFSFRLDHSNIVQGGLELTKVPLPLPP